MMQQDNDYQAQEMKNTLASPNNKSKTSKNKDVESPKQPNVVQQLMSPKLNIGSQVRINSSILAQRADEQD